MEKELQELRREVQESRNLMIKTDALLKGLQGDLRSVGDRLRQAERQRVWGGVTAYFLFAALSVLGAYLFAKGGLRSRSDELARAREDAVQARAALEELKSAEKAALDESNHALELYERMGSGSGDKRNRALSEAATLAPKHLSALEIKVLRDRVGAIGQTAAADALDEARVASARRDWKVAGDSLNRYFGLVAGRPDDNAHLLLGQARHALRDYKGAVEPLQTFLKNVPGSRQGDTVTLMLGESLAESGDKARAAAVLRTGADRYYASPAAGLMRSRARKLEQELRAQNAPAAAVGDAAPSAPAAAKPRESAGTATESR